MLATEKKKRVHKIEKLRKSLHLSMFTEGGSSRYSYKTPRIETFSDDMKKESVTSTKFVSISQLTVALSCQMRRSPTVNLGKQLVEAANE